MAYVIKREDGMYFSTYAADLKPVFVGSINDASLIAESLLKFYIERLSRTIKNLKTVKVEIKEVEEST